MKALTTTEKDAIRDLLKVYKSRYISQNSATESLQGVSVGIISKIINSKYEKISDEMFRNISRQVGGTINGWQIHESETFIDLMGVLSDSQEYQEVTWATGSAGCGKSTTARIYAKEHDNVFVILCSEDMKKGDFVGEMAAKIGISTKGLSIGKTLTKVMNTLSEREMPLLIFDEADKLTDKVFAYFVSIYNRLEEIAGITFLSTNYIKRRMEIGLCYQKPGYEEMDSRICRKFYDLDPVNVNDVEAICKVNGIVSKKDINEILSDVEKYNFDLRRAKKKIHSTARSLAAQKNNK